MIKKWILSANVKVFEHQKAFEDQGFIDWKRTRSFNVSDIVYIYITKPTSKIMYKTEVIKTGLDRNSISDQSSYWKQKNYIDGEASFVRLKKLEYIDSDFLSYDVLKENGMKYPPQSPCQMNLQLEEYLNKYFTEEN